MKDNSEPTPPEIQASPSPEETPQIRHSSKILWYVGGGIIAFLFAVGLFTLMQKPTPHSTQQTTLSQKPTLPRSKTPGIITNVQTASALDSQGKAVAPVTTFAKTDKNIYLALTLNKPIIGTKIEYIRYLNEKYLDSGTNQLLKAGVTNTSFLWSLNKPGAMHLVGTYKVKTYTNGIFEKETVYTVR